MPVVPNTANAEYWNVLASPKNTTHNTPLAAAEKGNSICANEMM